MSDARAPEEIEFDEFRDRFLSRAAMMIIGICVILIPPLFLTHQAWQAVYPALGAAMMFMALWFLRRGNAQATGLVFVVGAIGVLGIYDFIDKDDNGIGTAMLLVVIFTTALLFSERLAWITTGLVCAGYAIGEWNQYEVKGLLKVLSVIFESGSTITACYVSVLFSRRQRENRAAAIARREELEIALGAAEAIARGNLTRRVEGQDDVSQAVQKMQGRLAGVVGDLQKAAGVIAPTSAEIAAMAQQNQHLATEQAGAVMETRASLESVAATAQRIADSAGGVLDNAEATSEMNRRVADRLQRLVEVYQRINKLLGVIGGVSRKSEILALNAALEGIRAGEAGRGFGLVANEMQQLAEQVQEAADDAATLVFDIQEATAEANETFQESARRAENTTTAARSINMATQQQRSATQQLLMAIGELEKASRELADGSKQTLESVDHLRDLSGTLGTTLSKFEVGKG